MLDLVSSAAKYDPKNDPKIVLRQPCYSPSPGGEGWDEGELNTDRVGQADSRAVSAIFRWASTSNPVKASQGQSSLVKHFLKKLFFPRRRLIQPIPALFRKKIV
jgi:hypothetical protein